MGTERTREVVGKYFTALENGDLGAAMALLSPDVDFELPRNEWNAVIPYLGRHRGRAAVERAFAVRGETTETLDYAMRTLWADGDTAVATIYTKAAATSTGREYVVEDAHVLVVGDDALISSWKVYFDPNDEVAAFTDGRDGRLVAAAWAGDSAAAGALLDAGAAVDHRDPASGLTPLMIAAGRADAALVRLLLDRGANVFDTDSGAGATALHKACQGGSVEIARMLVDAGAFVDAVAPTTGHTPLFDAVWFKFPDLVAYLLDQGAGLNLATHYGFSLQQHFDYEVGVNTTGEDEMARAARYYEARKADDERRAGEQALMAAVTAGDVDEVRRLVVGGAEVDERFPIVNGFNDAHTPLLVAARDGHVQAVRLLLEAGADVNAVEPTFGAVPLHKAVYNGHADSTRIIAERPGVDLDFQGATNGYSPLHDALWHGYDECARILVEAGAALDRVGHDGKTPLALATEVLGPAHPVTELIAAKAAA
jgi:ankyrin repeat protein/ketosteroid isomerase-like protein